VLHRVGSLDWCEVAKGWDDASVAESASSVDLDESNPSAFAQMLEQRALDDANISTVDLRDVLNHLLASQLAELEATSPYVPPDDARTLREALLDQTTDIELLQELKRFGRRQARTPGDELPADVASVVYFGAMAAALVHQDERISKSADDVLAHGFQLAAQADWVDPAIKALLNQAAARVLGGNGP